MIIISIHKHLFGVELLRAKHVRPYDDTQAEIFNGIQRIVENS